MNYSQTFLMANMSAFPAETLPIIKEELDQLDEKSANMLLMTDIKNPVTALLFALFLGELGVDRFYIGNKELGIAKLALTVIGYLTLFIVLGFFLLLGVYIWKFVDCFLIMKACKQANFERFMWQINQAKLFQQARSKATENVQNTEAEPAKAKEMVVTNDEAMDSVAEVVEEMPVVSEEVGEAAAEVVEVETVPVVDEEVREVLVAVDEVETRPVTDEVEVDTVVEVAEEVAIETGKEEDNQE